MWILPQPIHRIVLHITIRTSIGKHHMAFMHGLPTSTEKREQDLATEWSLTCSQSPQSIITGTACQVNGLTHPISTKPFIMCVIHDYTGRVPQTLAGAWVTL